MNLLAGPPNVGKTAFLAWFLRQIYLGTPIFGMQPNPVPRIGVISMDRSWRQSTSRWYRLAGWEEGELAHYCLQDDRTYNIAQLAARNRRMDVLKHCLDKLGDLPFGSLVTVDPIAPFMGGNLLDYDSCLVACTLIRRLCYDRGLTLFGIAHASKQKNDKKEQYVRLQDRIIGSAGQFGYSDTQMYLASPEETGQPHYTFLWHPHHAKPQLFPLGRREDGLFVPYGEGVQETEQKKVLDVIPAPEHPEWETGRDFGTIIVESGVARTSVWRHLQAALKESSIERIGHGRYRKVRVN